MNTRTVIAALVVVSLCAGCRSSKKTVESESVEVCSSTEMDSLSVSARESILSQSVADVETVEIEFRMPDSLGRSSVSRVRKTTVRTQRRDSVAKSTEGSSSVVSTEAKAAQHILSAEASASPRLRLMPIVATILGIFIIFLIINKLNKL